MNWDTFNNGGWEKLFAFLLKVLWIFQIFSIVELSLYVGFGIEIVLESVLLLHFVVDDGGNHKTGKINEAFSFVGHDVMIWEY